MSRGRLVLGAAQLGQAYGTGIDRAAPEAHDVAEILSAASGLGIEDLDTARAYGDSELNIGAVLAGTDLRFRIITKIRPLGEDAELNSPDVIEAVVTSAQESIAALAVPSVDVILLHRAADAGLADGAAVRALQQLVAEGVTNSWGVSVSSPEELFKVLSYPDLTYIQLPFNVLDRRWLAPDVQAALRARPDVHITARSVLLQGLLSNPDVTRWPAINGLDATTIHRQIEQSRAALGRRDALDLCLAYAVGQPWIDQVVLGVHRAEQLHAIAERIANEPLAAREIQLVNELLLPGVPQLVDPAKWPPRPAATSSNR